MLKDSIEKNRRTNVNSREIEKLQKTLPQYFDKDGNFKLEEFKNMLSVEEIDLNIEGYGIDFLGKSYAKYESALETETVLTPDIEHNAKEVNKDSENIYIVGDNLDGLKHLLKSYSNKIKTIYIDPPYNTGTDDFVYPDNFSFNAKEMSEKIGIEEEEANRILNLAGKSTHSAWLTFMYPRLLLSRDVLADDGVIMISIDDNEQSNLKLLCDEIFGEENFIANTVRNTNSSKNQANFISVSYDYTLVYAKNKTTLEEKHASNKWLVDKNNIDEYEKRVKYLINEGLSNEEITEELKQLTKYPRFIDFTNYWYFDDRGLYRKGDLGGVKNGDNTPILNPLTNKYDPVPPGGFRYNREKLQELIEENRIHFHTDGSLPTIKRYLSENRKQTPKGIMSDDQRPDDKMLKSFGTPFDNPKQLEYITRILSIFDKDTIVLDFFSGSATTAHAVMNLNAKDGGNRKYIMIQLPEEIKKGDTGYNEGFKTIDEIGRLRIKRSALKIREETGAEIDYGYKTYVINNIPENTINKLEEFSIEDNTGLLSVDFSTEAYKFNDVPGNKTILTTLLNKHGYGLGVVVDAYQLDSYEASKIDNSLYIIDEGLTSDDVMALVRDLENSELNINRVVVYAHSISFSVLHELRNNLKNLKNSKTVHLIEEY